MSPRTPILLLTVTLIAALTSSARGEVPTVWNFDNPANRFEATFGPGVMTYYDPGATNWGPTSTGYGSASSRGLPLLPDGFGGVADSNVMCFPKTTPQQGYRVAHNAPFNGAHIEDSVVSNYTLVWDIYWPQASDGQWRSVFQTNTSNANDGDFFVLNAPSGGVGISGRYHGSLPPGQWHRLAVVVRGAGNGPRALGAEGQMQKFIDGVFVGGQGTTGSGIDYRWTLDPTFYLFADESNDTQAGCISSFFFIDRQLTMDEVRYLGGVNAAGADMPGLPPPPIPISTPRRVDIIGHRGKSCCAPENTLPSLQQAFETGASYAEIDVRLTAPDGANVRTAVLMHDSVVDRTTNGAGPIASMSVAHFKQLDAGSWFSGDYVGTAPPTLAEAMTLAKSYGKKLYLDIKVTGMGSAIAAAAAEAGFNTDDLWLGPYNNLTDTANLRQNIPNGKVIFEPDANWATNPNYFANLKAAGVWGFDAGTGNGAVNPAFVQAAHAAGMYVATYTILDPIAMQTAIQNGVDGMETDFTHILDAMMPRHGDINLDGQINRTDLATLIRNWGRSGDASWPQGNFELEYANRSVGLADLVLMQREWTGNGPGSPNASVPEPATWVLVMTAMVAFHCRRRVTTSPSSR